MSKLYNLYLDYKNKNKDFLYLFRCGNFYIFLGEDANYISKITTLKKTKFSKETDKCGFPVNSLKTYSNIFEELKLKVKIIENEDNNIDKIINKLSNIDIEKTTGIEALLILKELKEYL